MPKTKKQQTPQTDQSANSAFEFSTPFLKQYQEIKKQYVDCLVFYRMGDFYELFMEDAHIGARILNITLTSKRGGKDGNIPMAGIPYHAVDAYLGKLIKAGYKVAICEQLSPPNKRGLVERDVVRVVTPGTLLDEHLLNKKENNYIVSINVFNNFVALAVADLSTGYFSATLIDDTADFKNLFDELSRLEPSECILSDQLYNDTEFLKLLKKQNGLNIFPYTNWERFLSEPKEFLEQHFGIKTLDSFITQQQEEVLQCAAVLLGYLKETQKGNVSHIKKIYPFGTNDGLILDRSSVINLELFSTIREHDTRGSLLSVLDQTITAMGGRLLKQWVKKPLIDKEKIEERFDAIECFIENPEFKKILHDQLKLIPDIERLLSRLSVNLGNARDLVNLKQALLIILQVKELLTHMESSLLKKEQKNISTDLIKVSNYISQTIIDEPPIGIREGGMIKNGINKELDTLRNIVGNSKEWITTLEKKEREKTGINSLKIKFNKVFGFYIEISNANLHLVPDYFDRKQTLVNGERFITKELKKHEEIILTSEEKINELEYKLFTEILTFVLEFTNHVQTAAQSIAVLDCIANFSELSEKYRYTRPKLLYSGEIRIKQGRHPVVEKLLDNKQFCPNDVTLDNVSQQLLLITGPNMAGKSVFIRQIAVIVLMAQIGCFVPAQSAHISIVDRIFVRSGASDVITSGLSTFMVEMVETAHILHNATKNSLIIMDEIGRGTSTYDGISIAWAVAEYLVTAIKPSPKTLFATHYHELQQLEEQFPNSIKNFHMAVTDEKGEPIFLHTILPGGASHSFGVAVAKLAGIPEEVINRAKELLHTLEENRHSGESNDSKIKELSSIERSWASQDDIKENNLLDQFLLHELEQVDIGTMTPLEALNKLAELKDQLKLLKSPTDKFLEAD
jgi:DNA mismatch repair protein MutS